MPEIVINAGSAILRGVSRIVQPMGSGVRYETTSPEVAVCREAAETWRQIGGEMKKAMQTADIRAGK